MSNSLREPARTQTPARRRMRRSCPPGLDQSLDCLADKDNAARRGGMIEDFGKHAGPARPAG